MTTYFLFSAHWQVGSGGRTMSTVFCLFSAQHPITTKIIVQLRRGACTSSAAGMVRGTEGIQEPDGFKQESWFCTVWGISARPDKRQPDSNQPMESEFHQCCSRPTGTRKARLSMRTPEPRNADASIVEVDQALASGLRGSTRAVRDSYFAR